MSPFCKLAAADQYVACDWDLSLDREAREYWVPFFKQHLLTMLNMGIIAGGSSVDCKRRAAECQSEFWGHFDRYAASPTDFGRVTIYTLDAWRDQFLRKHGFDDVFANQKRDENERMLPLLPRVCAEIDQLGGARQIQAIVEGVFAGNIFDMGAGASAAKLLAGQLDFFVVRQELPPRPWLIDDFDSLEARLLRADRHRKAVFFVDNAGSDFLLGAVPMMRWLAMRGTQVVLAANERPSLNDMTIHDVRAWWPRIVLAEPSLAALPIQCVSTGTGEPLIDLSTVSDELNSAAADADLVILEGMGRGIESNLDASFSCEALNLAMIKDEMIARRCGGKLFDVVCRFR